MQKSPLVTSATVTSPSSIERVQVGRGGPSGRKPARRTKNSNGFRSRIGVVVLGCDSLEAMVARGVDCHWSAMGGGLCWGECRRVAFVGARVEVAGNLTRV